MDILYVTVYVMNYNEKETIVETLDSIYNQTYHYLDLMIHDDASTDGSLEIIDKWVTACSGRFRNVEIIKNRINQGINYTFDKCLKTCRTEWVKVIAADDILHPECVEKNVEYVKKYGIDSVLYSQDLCFIGDVNHAWRRGLFEQKYIEKLCKLCPEKQYRHLLRRGIMYAPTAFINTNTYKTIGGISTKVRNIEDYPLTLSFTSAGYSLYFMNEETVYYRIGDSVSRSRGFIYSTSHLEQVGILYKELIYPNVPWYAVLFWYEEIVKKLRYMIVVYGLGNKDTKKNRIINSLLMCISFSYWKKLILKTYYKIRYNE